MLGKTRISDIKQTGLKYPCFPHPAFKNQLAIEDPDSVAPVVIPALSSTLDMSLKSDRSLCLVRALHYYGQDLIPQAEQGFGLWLLQKRL